MKRYVKAAKIFIFPLQGKAKKNKVFSSHVIPSEVEESRNLLHSASLVDISESPEEKEVKKPEKGN